MISILHIAFSEYRQYLFTALGTHTIAGYIQHHLHDNVIQSVWYYSDRKEELEKYIHENKIDAICFSVNIGYLEPTINIIRLIQKKVGDEKLKNINFIFGNREFLQSESRSEIFKLLPQAYIVIDEGEVSVHQILKHKSINTISNLFYMSKEGKICFTFRKQMPSENYIAPLYKMFVINSSPLFLNQLVAYVEVSRGCNKSLPCSFCSNSGKYIYRNWRYLNHNEIIKSIKSLLQFKPCTINFVSEDFLGNMNKNIIDLLSDLYLMKERKIIYSSICFYCAIKVTDVFSSQDSINKNEKKEKIISKMKDIGFNCIYVGFESGSNNQLKRFNKNYTVNDSLKTIKLLRKHKIHIDGGFITFDPLSNLDEVLENMTFLKLTKIAKLMLFPFNHLELFENTIYYNIWKRKKIKIDPDYQKFYKDILDINKIIPYYDHEQILQKLRLLYFQNSEIDKIQLYESAIYQYGEFCINFIENLVDLYKNQKYSQISNIKTKFISNYYLNSSKMINQIV